MSRRAPALPPNERRAALVECTLDLIREGGAVPSTREIAEAAGVAEGTIFRAFETKDDLLDEAIAVTFCPAPLTRLLETVDPALPLRDRLVSVVAILQHRYADMFGLLRGLRLTAPPVAATTEHADCTAETGHVAVSPTSHRHGPESSRHRHRDRGQAHRAIVGLIEPDTCELTCTPEELARYLRLLTFSGSHVQICDGEMLAPETIVDVLLTGALTRERAV